MTANLGVPLKELGEKLVFLVMSYKNGRTKGGRRILSPETFMRAFGQVASGNRFT